ncbi:MAG: type II toxin-antitoxin system RelB/DinJ family antitoxin [Deltaproteobacteria bacterium]|jgi:DNA-damage-inducible protein J|nr:type II toxin-antitoxin system RelB/DinJ family antitoxin [Deltaproteobacteria bacterium]
MTQNTLLRARIRADIKEEAASVLADIGLTVSDACRIFLTKVAREKALPFEFDTPNQETIEAMEELESGRGIKFDSKEALYKDLGLL